MTEPLDLPVDVPGCFPQVFHGVGAVLESRSPQVLDGVAHVEVVVLGDDDAFHPAGVTPIMRRMVHQVRGGITGTPAPPDTHPFGASSVRHSTASLRARRDRAPAPTPPLPRGWRVGRRGCCRPARSEEHTSELQSPCNLVCRLLLEKKKKK